MTRSGESAAILGVAEMAYGETDIGAPSEMARLCHDAVADSGLAPDDVDGLIVVLPRSAPNTWVDHLVAENLGRDFAFTRCVSQGGAAILQAVVDAAVALGAGLARNVLLVGVDRLRTGLPPGGAVSDMAAGGFREWESAYGPTIVAGFALSATRYMAEYGLTRRQLSTVAVAMRHNATLNPLAQMREPISTAEVEASRLVSSPFRLLDCSLVSDGGAALVIGPVPEGRTAVVLRGWGEAHSTRSSIALGETSNRACVTAGVRAYERAGRTPADMDAAFIYDPFTITPIIAVEDLGLAPRGTGAELFEPGRPASDGPLPINTHGGLLSCGHPGRPGALGHVVEAVRFLRSDSRQRDESAIIAAEGAQLNSYAALILARQ